METVEEFTDVNTEHSRAPNFDKKEVSALLDLIDKYKHIILNKSVTGAANRAKEIAWNKIAKEYNQLNLRHQRNSEGLKNKWSNLKKQSNQLGKNLNDSNIEDEHLRRAISLSYEADNIKDFDVAFEPEEELEDEEDHKKRVQRSLNFTPHECKLLINLMKKEKGILCSKTIHKRKKLHAWMRIADNFNKLSEQKRTRKTLMTKFQNMKNQAKSIKASSFVKDIRKRKHRRLENDVVVKEEQFSGDRSDQESIDNDVFDSASCPAPDPLYTVLNGDVINGGFTNSDYGRNVHVPIALSNEKEVKEKMLELLNYQMETAKLERKRLLLQMKSESSILESRELEQSFKLRAARLEAAAAASKFPHSHPALKYTRDECQAELYMKTQHLDSM